MQIFIQKEQNISSQPLKDMAKDRLPAVVFHEEVADFSNAPWVEYNNDKKGIAKNWLYKQIDKFSNYFHNTLDFYFALIYAKHWGEPKVYGWHLGKAYKSIRICLVRNREDYVKTAEHELAHGVWSYIQLHTGIDLETVLGVSEYDAIHGNDEHEEYEYDWYWEAIAPYLQLAHGEDMALEYHSLLKLAIQRAKIVIRQLRS